MNDDDNDDDGGVDIIIMNGMVVMIKKWKTHTKKKRYKQILYQGETIRRYSRNLKKSYTFPSPAEKLRAAELTRKTQQRWDLFL